MTYKYLATCPYQKQVIRERGDWVTDKDGRSWFKVTATWQETVPCGERIYTIIDNKVFTQDSGLDPKGIKVRCKGCGQEYFVFPGRGERIAKEVNS